MSDTATVAQLLLKHRHEVVGYVYSVVPQAHAVEDIFQEVCLVAITKAVEFQEGTHFVAWARTIARHKIREHLRRRSVVPPEDAFFDLLDRAFEERRATVDLDSRREAMRLCLGELQVEARRVLSWRYEEGLSPEDIAHKTGRTRAGVNSLLQRIRELLRECVERRTAGAQA